ncbi:MAG: 50S ribosomal protein L13 [archaeon]
MTKETKTSFEKNMQYVIDATDAVTGRVASLAAKKALSGRKVIIVNSEKAVIIGSKSSILKKYSARIARGRGKQAGPYFHRGPEKILRRAVRGMLPFDRKTGRDALRNVKCYISVPPELKNSEKIDFKNELHADYMTLGELSKLL